MVEDSQVSRGKGRQGFNASELNKIQFNLEAIGSESNGFSCPQGIKYKSTTGLFTI